MYRIGEFANMTGLSIRTLRYYDSIDLLKPGYVDRFSGYRYYTDENLYDVYVINLLKSTNFSLEEIISYKNALTISVIDEKISELREKQEEINGMIETLEEMKMSVNNENVIEFQDKHPLKRTLKSLDKAS